MGVITGFTLMMETELKQVVEDPAALKKLLFEAGDSVRSTDIDKSWDDMLCVLRAIDYGEVVDSLARYPVDVDNEWGIWLRWINADDTAYITSWLRDLDADEITRKCTEQSVIGYEGEPLHEIGMLDYTVSCLKGLGDWLAQNVREGDALLVSTS